VRTVYVDEDGNEIEVVEPELPEGVEIVRDDEGRRPEGVITTTD
jgi:hypothetical protein